MDTTSPAPPTRRPPSRTVLSPLTAVLLALGLGLCGGYLDVAFIVLKRFTLNPEGSFRTATDFVWTVPLGHAVLLLVPAVLVALMNAIRPDAVSWRDGCWLFATLTIWSALLRMPLYGLASLILAIGLGRVLSGAIAASPPPAWSVRAAVAVLIAAVGITIGLSSGRQALREGRRVATLPAPPAAARNVLLIVWDTVRSYNLSLYGYPRETTPNLARWARQGVTYKRALAPAPWTFPSHCSFFTGQWPFQLNAQWKYSLDTQQPTLAEFLASRGYQTSAFVANTNCCNYETGLNRGFNHFDDYALTPRSLLSRTVPGKWILKGLVNYYNVDDLKWIDLQSRGAREVNHAFLDWLGERRTDRPFFAFLNYFDAHEPYLPPPGYENRFGIAPQSPKDYKYLVDFVGMSKPQLGVRDFLMVRDCYDDCIAYLDEQFGRLLDALRARGLLENTDVILTSDHGEAFGDHGTFGHSYGLNLDEIGVPLVILSSRAPVGRVVDSPVSLRDLPATVVDMLGLSATAPFPGHSLAGYWNLAPGENLERATPALSEQADSTALQPQPRLSRGHRGFQMSLVASDHHYIRHGLGTESLYDLKTDPFEQHNLMESPAGQTKVGVFRKMLLEALANNPASAEVDKAYLERYRGWLSELTSESEPFRLPERPIGAAVRLDNRRALE
jgi:arylsulfatase A-like enzyme